MGPNAEGAVSGRPARIARPPKGATSTRKRRLISWLVLSLMAILLTASVAPGSVVTAEGAPTGDRPDAVEAAAPVSSSGTVTVTVTVRRTLLLTVDSVRQERDGDATILTVSGTVKANTGWELLADTAKMGLGAAAGSVTRIDGDGRQSTLGQVLEQGRPTRGYHFEHRFRIEGDAGQFPVEALSYVIVPTT